VAQLNNWQRGEPVVHTVAILPFESDRPFNKDGESLAAAINRELIPLAPELKVTAHAAAAEHRMPNMAAAFLHVRWVVTGKIEQRGAELIIRAELIDVNTQVAVWSESFPAKSSADPAVARAIAGKVRGELTKIK
jgi:TolB-like protein